MKTILLFLAVFLVASGCNAQVAKRDRPRQPSHGRHAPAKTDTTIASQDTVLSRDEIMGGLGLQRVQALQTTLVNIKQAIEACQKQCEAIDAQLMLLQSTAQDSVKLKKGALR